jgi:S-adenosylmethionine decarboxylase proenzyme
MNYQFAGTHVLADIYDIEEQKILDNYLIMEALRKGITESGATLCGERVKFFDPNGLTAVFLLEESHVAVHTYPEMRALFIDTFTCGTTCRPEKVVEVVVEALGSCKQRTSVLQRGTPMVLPPSYQAVAAASVVQAG